MWARENCGCCGLFWRASWGALHRLDYENEYALLHTSATAPYNNRKNHNETDASETNPSDELTNRTASLGLPHRRNSGKFFYPTYPESAGFLCDLYFNEFSTHPCWQEHPQEGRDEENVLNRGEKTGEKGQNGLGRRGQFWQRGFSKAGEYCHFFISHQIWTEIA